MAGRVPDPDPPLRLMGLDPGLRRTGWGIIDVHGTRLKHIANGVVSSSSDAPLASRLADLFEALAGVLHSHGPKEAAVEETFVSRNAASTLKLGMARGVSLLVAARAGLSVTEYPANVIKKSLVGAGHAAKPQVALMVGHLLGADALATGDAADALAVAICHAHRRTTQRVWTATAMGIQQAGLRS